MIYRQVTEAGSRSHPAGTGFRWSKCGGMFGRCSSGMAVVSPVLAAKFFLSE